MDNVEIDEDLVRSLLRDQHPDLAGLGLREVPAGWDNKLWRLGDELAVRLPRTSRAPGLLRKEYRWLPSLAPRLPLPVPTPVRIGEPSDRFPKTWTVVKWVPGEPADRASISRGDHAAENLAGFLKALHQKAPRDAPVSASRGAPIKSQGDEFLQADAPDGLRKVWEDAVSAPAWDGPPLWLHGDLHPANVVVSEGALSGVIDFGELCGGDPALDLEAAWLILPAGTAPRFFAAYGGADEATIGRARGWALRRAFVLIEIGRAWEQGLPGGQPTWGRAGRAALERVLTGQL
jgi:aminoglycoside phosphotransferase (APT) family kinase protein